MWYLEGDCHSRVTGSSRDHHIPVEGRMYIDPTAGSLVLQVIAAGVLSAVAMFARVREGMKSFFRSLLPRQNRWTGKP